MIKEEHYLTPKVEEIELNIEGSILDGSNRGFIDDPEYNGNRWGLN